MSAVDTLREARKSLESLEVELVSTQRHDESSTAKIERLQAELAALRDDNTLLRTRLGETDEQTGGTVAMALRAAAVYVYSDHRGHRFADGIPMARKWLKSRGWGEQDEKTMRDPQTRDVFTIAMALDMQARRDLDGFKSLAR